MALFLIRRIVGVGTTLFVASIVVYGALYLAPGTVVDVLLGGTDTTPKQIAAIRAQYHLDQPFLIQYGHWLRNVLHGDLGRSALFSQPVTTLIGPRLINTLLLVLYASILIVVAGVGLGLIAGLSRGRLGTAILAGASVGIAIPPFVAAVILLALFSVSLRWFPILGAGSGLVGHLQHLTLPALALAIPAQAYICNVTASEVRAQRASEHTLTARSRGIPWPKIVLRHILRNSMILVSTSSALVITSLIAGGAVVEVAFGINGVGALLVSSVQQRDLVVVQGISLLLVSAYAVMSLFLDLLYALLDPRISRSR